MSYKDELKKQYEEACEKCKELAETSDIKDGFLPIIEACQKRKELKEKLEKL